MTGAVIHHAEESSVGINMKEATIAQGYLLCGESVGRRQLPRERERERENA